MEEEDDIFENQAEFLAEKNAWDRIGGVDIGLGLGGVINLKKSGYTINEKFKLIALATINIINDLDGNITLNLDEITHLLSLVEKIPDFEYKNPSAFVLGYLVAIQSDYTNIKINKNVLEDVLEINTYIEDQLFSKIENVDIVRYTRLCLFNKLK
ncbi:hypothetical protein IIV30_021R [Invertebrate iridescent virus 30]|uniref:Uncharacterized protein n=2 Tax=Invertebrate iridescent virus 22 TaxID=345198 RepID=W8W250_9VIRU|nr:hypothetical protein IIV30_021R [Invertebrate iridescent virus 30]YP_009010784.1 hypothetical protein IIV22A_023R [Invertebrate iridescent virus 22]CCV01867.1 hypothetical protein IIV22A_023R [Invertebrate iridescent virus 22]CCV02216.1 hypothetical protein IIV30_021R [Invertebrate iridescent virus 30]